MTENKSSNWDFTKVDDIRPYERNAKKHDKKQIDNVARSIKEFGMVQPIVIDKDNNVIIGHCRLAACKQLGLEVVPTVKLEDLSPEEANKLRLLDNKLNESEWDFDLLAEDIPEIDFTGYDIEWDLPEALEPDYGGAKNSLLDKFIVPPFSVLDTRQGYWQDRKKAWKELGIKSEIGRDAKAYTTEHISDKYGRKSQNGTSIFDPVLCEIMYKWFNVDGGLIYDCFAGGSVRGIVAEKLGYKYIGIDIRQEQVNANYENASDIGGEPIWYCDDSRNVDKYIKDNTVDMIFSCPPYGDLEVYSDDPNDISNMSYEDFCVAYKEIIDKACNKLKKDCFAVFVVGDIRDKNGAYRNFVDFTKKCFNDNGLITYNEAILLDMLGTAMIRANQTFKSRKLVKVHQNVVIFYKGDPKNIKKTYTDIELNDNMFEQWREEDD